jgi:transcriptional regulator with XRE-family HTH domain
MSGLSGLDELSIKIDRDGTRRSFAEKLKISENYLSQILSGTRPFARLPVATALKISELSGISIERLNNSSNPSGSSIQKKRAAHR